MNLPPPLTTLAPLQRLAWLDRVKQIRCHAAAPWGAFTAGENYAVETRTRRTATRQTRPNMLGHPEEVTLHGYELLVVVWPNAERGTRNEESGTHHFSNYQPAELSPHHHAFEELVAHFTIPEVPDVTQVYPERYQAALDWITEFEQAMDHTGSGDRNVAAPMNPFRFRAFQREDLARAAAAAVEHDDGRAEPLRLRCVGRPSLATLVAGCFDYVGCDEGVRLKADDSYSSLGVRRLNPRHRLVLTGTPVKNRLDDIFWLLQWASNGGFVLGWEQGLGKSLALLVYGMLCLAIERESSGPTPSPCHLGGRHLLVVPESLHLQLAESAKMFGIELRTLRSAADFARDPLLQQWQRDHLAGRESAIAGFWITSYLQLGFNGADESKAESGSARLLPSAATINVGEVITYWQTAKTYRPTTATARFPFDGTAKGREGFAGRFMLTEENHTKAAVHRTGKTRTFTRQVPCLCNEHRLWRVLAPLLIRRTEADLGGQMVPLTVVPLTVPPGRAQLAAYREALAERQNAPGGRVPPNASVLPIIMRLRTIACCGALHDNSHPVTPSPSHQVAAHTPKLTAILEKIADLMALGEQVVVLSPFQPFNTTLHRLLIEAGVASVLLDGRVDSDRRGELARRFKAGGFVVLVGGQKAMGEGHSFECASHLIVPALEQALDINLQVPKRIHRINSKRPCFIYPMVTSGTIDVRLTAGLAEKRGTASRALSANAGGTRPPGAFLPAQPPRNAPGGRVPPSESPAALLQAARADFDPYTAAVDEAILAAAWEASLKPRLREAMAGFREARGALECGGSTPLSEGTSGGCAPAKAVSPLRSATALQSSAPPDSILRFLAHLPAGADVTTLRTSFEAYMHRHKQRDWRRAWEDFAADRKTKTTKKPNPCPSPSIPPPKPRTPPPWKNFSRPKRRIAMRFARRCPPRTPALPC